MRLFNPAKYLFVSQMIDGGAEVVKFTEVCSLFFFSPRGRNKTCKVTKRNKQKRCSAGGGQKLQKVLRTLVPFRDRSLPPHCEFAEAR